MKLFRYLPDSSFSDEDLERFDRQKTAFETGLATRVAEYKFLETEVAVHQARKIHQETLHPSLTKKVARLFTGEHKGEAWGVLLGSLAFFTPLALVAGAVGIATCLSVDAARIAGRKLMERQARPPRMSRRQMMETINDEYERQFRLIMRAKWDDVKKGMAVAQLQAEYDEAIEQIRQMR